MCYLLLGFVYFGATSRECTRDDDDDWDDDDDDDDDDVTSIVDEIVSIANVTVSYLYVSNRNECFFLLSPLRRLRPARRHRVRVGQLWQHPRQARRQLPAADGVREERRVSAERRQWGRAGERSALLERGEDHVPTRPLLDAATGTGGVQEAYRGG